MCGVNWIEARELCCVNVNWIESVIFTGQSDFGFQNALNLLIQLNDYTLSRALEIAWSFLVGLLVGWLICWFISTKIMQVVWKWGLKMGVQSEVL